MNTDCYGGEKEFITSVLEQFTVEECLEFFHSIGIYPKNKNGYYYPNSEQAASVVHAFLCEMERLGVTMIYEIDVKDIVNTEHNVSVDTNKGRFTGNRLVIATGLLAAPKLGSDGSLFEILKGLGHRFNPILPALCGFYCKGLRFKNISGVRAHGTVSAYIDDEKKAEDTGEIQFTDYGLSGIPVFQISRYLSKGIYEKRNVEIKINLLPDFDRNQLVDEINYRRKIGSIMPVSIMLNGLVHQKLADMILEKAGIDREIYATSLSAEDMSKIASYLQEIKVKVTNYRDFEFAQVCTGGIPVSDIQSGNLESKFARNIFFTGEILDVDGICGGYNLHFAWATGHIVGKAV